MGTDSPSSSGIPNIVLYDYQSGRAGQCAVDYLDGFSGYLPVDGYAGYEKTSAKLAGVGRTHVENLSRHKQRNPKEKCVKRI